MQADGMCMSMCGADLSCARNRLGIAIFTPMGAFQILPTQHDHGQVQRLPRGIELRYGGGDGRRWIVELVMA